MEDYKVYMRYDFGTYIIEKMLIKNGKVFERKIFDDVNDAIDTLIRWTQEIEDVDVYVY